MAQPASPQPQPRRAAQSPSGLPRGGPSPQGPPHVRLSWLLGALGLLAAAAIVCAYLSLCLLFYQGQWQLLYHPTPLGKQTPATAGLAFSPVQFSADEHGAPRLTGWWLPAAAPDARTILYLHGERGSLSDTIPALAAMHADGFSIFAIDYRGYGASAAAHPSEAQLIDDVRAARFYLLETRHVSQASLSVWGVGLGATLAAEATCNNRPDLPLILEQPNLTARTTLEADPRVQLFPLTLLQRDLLDAGAALAACRSPKFFLAGADGLRSDTDRLFRMASQPKQLATDVSAVPQFLQAVPRVSSRAE